MSLYRYVFEALRRYLCAASRHFFIEPDEITYLMQDKLLWAPIKLELESNHRYYLGLGFALVFYQITSLLWAELWCDNTPWWWLCQPKYILFGNAYKLYSKILSNIVRAKIDSSLFRLIVFPLRGRHTYYGPNAKLQYVSILA